MDCPLCGHPSHALHRGEPCPAPMQDGSRCPCQVDTAEDRDDDTEYGFDHGTEAWEQY